MLSKLSPFTTRPLYRLMSSPAAKRMKSTKVRRTADGQYMVSPQVIGTHSGTFHCDEALAVFMLRQTAEFKDAGASCDQLQSAKLTPDVVRTRDPAKRETDTASLQPR